MLFRSAIESGNDQENEHPTDINFREIGGARDRAAPPYGRCKSADVEKNDHVKQVVGHLRHVFESALGLAEGIEQAPYSEEDGDFGDGNILEARDEILKASAINNEEGSQPKKGGLGGIRHLDRHTPCR